MHREISHTDSAFSEESNLPLYWMTGLLAVLLALDVLPLFGEWMGWTVFQAWPKGLAGASARALIAAILGGARIVYISLAGACSAGKIGADLAIAIACLFSKRAILHPGIAGRRRGRVYRHVRRMPGSIHIRPDETRHSQDRRSLSAALLGVARRYGNARFHERCADRRSRRRQARCENSGGWNRVRRAIRRRYQRAHRRKPAPGQRPRRGGAGRLAQPYVWRAHHRRNARRPANRRRPNYRADREGPQGQEQHRADGRPAGALLFADRPGHRRPDVSRAV